MIKLQTKYDKQPQPVAARFLWGGTWPCYQSPQRIAEIAGTGEQAKINAADAARREARQIAEIQKRKK